VTEFVCKHIDTQIRKKRLQGGGIHVCQQCLTCGRVVGKYLKHVDFNLRSLPDWDDELPEKWILKERERWEGASAVARKAAREKDAAWWKSYDEYLRTPVWRAKRAQVLRRAGGRCEGCRNAEATTVHHLTYDHVGHEHPEGELLFELVAVCGDCHWRLHPLHPHLREESR